MNAKRWKVLVGSVTWIPKCLSTSTLASTSTSTSTLQACSGSEVITIQSNWSRTATQVTWLLMGTLNVVLIVYLTTISRISKIFGNFERLFTPQTSLRLVWKFGKTRFRRFPTFHFLTPEKKFGEISGSENLCFAILVRFLRGYSKMELKFRFHVKFCSRSTYPEVCTTKNHQNALIVC